MSQPDWIGRLPQGWSAARLRHVAAVSNSNVDKKSYDDGHPVRLCNYTDVYYNDFITDDMELMRATATGSEIQRFQLYQGDVIITKDSESWDDIAIPACVAEPLTDVVCGYHLTLLRPLDERLNGRFLLRALQAQGVREQFWLAANGITRFGLGQQGMKDALLPIPPVPGQKAIADFLDRKTAAIDALIEKKQKLLDLLAEKRSALINQAVTKGLHPDVPMKDSGIPWIGEIPARWDVARLKFLVATTVDCHHSTPTYEADGQFPALRTSDISPGFLDLDGARRVGEDEFQHRISRLRPRPGDVIYSREGERYGMAAAVPDGAEVCLAQRVMLFRPDAATDSTFFMWALNATSVYQQMRQYVVGATSPHVNIGDIREAWLPVPPLPEQERIARLLSDSAARDRAMAAKVEQHIERLQEYRQALITAAVTGQLDVEAAA